MAEKQENINTKTENLSKNSDVQLQLFEITEDLINSAPECDIIEPDAELDTEPDTEPDAEFENKTDNKGRFFDINLHKVDENGLPVLNKNGSLAIKRGRNKKTEPLIENEKKFDNKNAGKLFAQYTFAFCSGIFGKEFLPVQNEEINEVELISNAYADYLESKDISEVSPNIILVGSLSLYILPRLMQEKVQENILVKVKKIYRKIMKR